MSKYDKQFGELIEAEEKLLKEVYDAKLAHLDKELEVRFNLPDDKGFKIVEPKYEYENTPEYIEHMKNSLKLSVMEEKAKVHAALNNIERNKLQRKEMSDLKRQRN